jgi:xanthine dehydrogenase accessory factor
MLVSEAMAVSAPSAADGWNSKPSTGRAKFWRVQRPSLALPLGPAIGQCCGGHVTLSFEVIPPARFDEIEALVEAEDARDPEVWLFGGGHVGRALAAALLLLAGQGACGGDAGRRAGSHAEGAERHLTALPESLVAGHCAGKRGDRADP